MFSSGFLIILLICAAISFIVGALVAVLYFEREKADAKRKAFERTLPAAIRKGGHEAVARLWRERSGGRLVIEMDESVYNEARELGRGDRQMLEKAALDWVAWLGIPLPSAPAPKPAPKPEVSAAPAVVPAVSAAPLTPPPAAQPIATGPSAAAASPSQPLPASIDGKKPPKSIAAQIDEVLQEMLETSPLRSRGIRLIEEPGHKVVVWVGLTRFDGVEAVADPEVKAFIKSAVAQWEQRNASIR